MTDPVTGAAVPAHRPRQSGYFPASKKERKKNVAWVGSRSWTTTAPAVPGARQAAVGINPVGVGIATLEVYRDLEPQEQAAREHLAETLGDDVLLVGGARITAPRRGGSEGRREIDCVFISPTRLLVLELKHGKGVVSPTPVDSWGREFESDEANPFDQAELAAQILEGFLQARRPARSWRPAVPFHAGAGSGTPEADLAWCSVSKSLQ